MTPDGDHRPAKRAGLRSRVEAYEERLVVDALLAAEGSVATAARRLGVSRRGLYKRMERLGIEPEDYRGRGT